MILNVTVMIMPGLMVVGAVLARRNVKLGRGDRRGAFRSAATLFFMVMGAWLLGDRHVAHAGAAHGGAAGVGGEYRDDLSCAHHVD